MLMLMLNGQSTLTYSCECIFSNVRLVRKSVNWSPPLRFSDSYSVDMSHLSHACHMFAHFILTESVTLIIFHEEYKLLISSPCD